MDILAHALYGATIFSKSGIAGTLQKNQEQRPKNIIKDPTVWAACFFGVVPDIFSLGIYFLYLSIKGIGIRWYGMPYEILLLYKLLHSLPFVFLIILLVRFFYKPLVLPSLAWPLHVIIDFFLHDQGKFKTPLFFPFSNINIKGINWWENPRIIGTYWIILTLLWMVIIITKKLKANKTQEPS